MNTSLFETAFRQKGMEWPSRHTPMGIAERTCIRSDMKQKQQDRLPKKALKFKRGA